MYFWKGLLIGILIGFFVVPIIFWIYWLITKTKLRRNIKKMIKNKQILMPIDENDFDSKKWTDLFDKNNSKEQLESLNKNIFKKPEEIKK